MGMKKVQKRNYIFTNKKHPQRAIMSTILGIISMVSLIIVIYLTYLKDGQAPISYGLTGLLIVMFSFTGLLLGLFSLKESDRYHLFQWIGLIVNGIVLIAMAFIIYAGMYA